MSTKIVVSLKANHYASVYKFLWESLINIFGFFCQFYFSEKKYKKFLSSEEEEHAITHYKINYALIGVGFQLELVIQSCFFFLMWSVYICTKGLNSIMVKQIMCQSKYLLSIFAVWFNIHSNVNFFWIKVVVNLF